ncbi:13E12 repeat family protein, partial [Spelaeicoccus albus]
MKKAGGVPGPEHSADMPDASMFAGVADVNVATLDAGECLEYAGRCAQLAAFVQARQTEFLAAFGSYRTDPDKAFDADGAFTEASGVPGTDDDKPAASSPETTNAGAADADTSRARAANAGVANAGVADPIAAANAVGPADCAGITARDIFAESLVRWAGDEVGCELDIAGRTGASRLIESELAVMCLPRTLAAFKAGRISARRYRKILDQAGHLPAALARQLDDTVDGWDDGISFDAFSRRLKRWIMAHQPDRTEEDHARVITDRRVEFMPDAAGAAWLMAYGPADRLALLYRRLDKAAHATDGADTRTSPQKRFDLLAGTRPSADEDTGADESTSDDNSVADGSRWRIGVTIPVTTLLGGTLPGHMNGYGPIPAAMARRLAAGAGWIERILTDPITSRPIDAERGHYRLTTGA